MNSTNIRLGIFLMIISTFIFALQDGISRHLAGEYNVYMISMIRYWFFASFVIAIAKRQSGSIREAAKTDQLGLQIFRGVLLTLEIYATVFAFTVLGLVETHAIFICYPLIIAALSGIILGETVGWQRWSAIGVGFIGVLIVLQPRSDIFSIYALVPLLAAVMFALYGLLTRYAARKDKTSTSFFWTGVSGAVLSTCVGVWFWEPMVSLDWGWMGLLCITGVIGHFTLIKCYEVAEASDVQPFAYFQLVFASALGVVVFSETLRSNVVIGAAIVIAAGLFTAWRARKFAPPAEVR